MEKYSLPPAPQVISEIESEEFSLLDFRKMHQKVLEESGIAEKAREEVGLNREKDYENELLQIGVAWTTQQDRDGNEIRVPNVVFDEREIDQNGREVSGWRYAPVAEFYAGVILPKEGYTDEEVLTVIGLLDGLDEARKQGILPHLSQSDSMTIHNPQTAMMKFPPK